MAEAAKKKIQKAIRLSFTKEASSFIIPIKNVVVIVREQYPDLSDTDIKTAFEQMSGWETFEGLANISQSFFEAKY